MSTFKLTTATLADYTEQHKKIIEQVEPGMTESEFLRKLIFPEITALLVRQANLEIIKLAFYYRRVGGPAGNLKAVLIWQGLPDGF